MAELTQPDFETQLRTRQQQLDVERPLPDPRSIPDPEERLGPISDRSVPFEERLRFRQQQLEKGTINPDPTSVDIRAENRFLARQVGQTSLGDPGMEDLGTRFKVGFQDTFQEQREAFLSKHPDGDFREAEDFDGRKTVLFRNNENDEFRKLDASSLEKLEILGDLADLSGIIPSSAAEAASLVGIKGLFKAAVGLSSQVLRIALGNITGEAAKEGIQAAQGTARETFGQAAGRTAATTGFATVAGAGTIALTGPINALRGRANIAIEAGAPAAQRAARNLGLPSPLPSQIARSPLIQKIGEQSAATVKTIGDYVKRQEQGVVRALLRLRESDVVRYVNSELRGIHDDAKKQIISAVTNRQVTLQQGGNSVAQGVAEYDDLAVALVNTAYSDARKIATPEFDVQIAKSMAQDIRGGTPSALNESAELLEDATQQQLKNIEPALQAEIDKITNLDPAMPPITVGEGESARVVTATDQLRQIRSNLWDLKTPNKGEIARGPQKDAGRLFGIVDHVLKNPKNARPEFLSAWREANDIASDRFSTMEKLIIVRAGRDETPAKLAARFVKPNEVDNIVVMRDVLPADRFREFQESALSDMVAPQNLTKLPDRLDSFDQPTLDALFTKNQQAGLRVAAEGSRRLEQSGIDTTKLLTDDIVERVGKIVDANDNVAAKLLVDNVGPKGGQRERAMRAAIVEHIINKTVFVDKNVRRVSTDAFQATLKDLNKKGFLKLLTFGDKRVLGQLKNYVDFVPLGQDPGVSITASSTAAGVSKLAISALASVFRRIGMGRAFTSKAFQRLTLGKGNPAKQFNSLRAMGAVLGNVAAEESIQ